MQEEGADVARIYLVWPSTGLTSQEVMLFSWEPLGIWWAKQVLVGSRIQRPLGPQTGQRYKVQIDSLHGKAHRSIG